MKAVELAKISCLIPIFKDGVEAERIQVARIMTDDGNICQFNVIVGNGIYNIGDEVIYIMPDYCIPDDNLFREYWRPGGDISKTRLGKGGRIRALKFNFKFADSEDAIYSNGIILPLSELDSSITKEIKNNKEFDLMTSLNIVKYVAEEHGRGQMSGLTKGELPGYLYATDEPRIESMYNHVNRVGVENQEILSITRKADGSSITIAARKNPASGEWETCICSRTQEKKLDQTNIIAYKDIETGVELHRYISKVANINNPMETTNIRGFLNPVSREFISEFDIVKTPGRFEQITSIVRDAWVDTVKENNYLDKLLDYCKKHNVELALRGELIGAGNKGSGNKLNSDAKRPKSAIIWFGVDDLSSGFATRIHYGCEHNLKKVCEELEFEYTPQIAELTGSYDDIIKFGNEYFKQMSKETGIIVEGIVIRSKYSNSLSCKFINAEYDSKI